MKKALTVLLFTAAALAAQASASTGATTPKAQPAAKTATKAAKKAAPAKPAATKAQPLVIPKGAIANSDGSYSWTDKQGKKWTFVKTPFGISRTETTAAPAASASLTGVKVFDTGDKVRFEMPTPFGVSKWEKNKTDLTDDERNAVNTQLNQNARQE
jgi:hypothetical protein